MKFLFLIMGLSATLGAMSCKGNSSDSTKGLAERAGEKIDRAVDDTGNKIDNTLDKAGRKTNETLRKAGDQIEDATKK